MKLSKNNLKIIDTLRDKQLNYLIKPFTQMVELDKLGKIKIHKMTWKVIMREIYSDLSKADLENMIISYLVAYGVMVVKKKRIDKSSKERVKEFRKSKKELGYKQLSVLISPFDLERLKLFKSQNNMTYQEALSYLIKKLPK